MCILTWTHFKNDTLSEPVIVMSWNWWYLVIWDVSFEFPGQIQQLGSGRDKIPSLAELQNLSCLEMLYMENTQLRDVSLNPISNLRKLHHLYLGGPLTDMSLFRFSSIQSLMHLSLHDAVFTGQGLNSFKPPSYLKVLDLSGCWLLTKDDLFLFSQRNAQIELKHELYHFVPSEQSISKYLSTSGVPTKTGQSKKKERKLAVLPQMLSKDDFIGMCSFFLY